MPAEYCLDCQGASIVLCGGPQISAQLDGECETWIEHRRPLKKYDRVLKFKSSAPALLQSARSGCPCCEFFVQTIEEFSKEPTRIRPGWLPPEDPPKELKSKFFIVFHNAREDKSHGQTQSTKPGSYAQGSYIKLYQGYTAFGRYELCTQGLVSMGNNGVNLRPIAMSASDSAAVDFLVGRFRDCLREHPGCRPHEFRPTRLLDLRPEARHDDSICLVRSGTTDTGRGGYVALSHCWGPDTLGRLKTNKSNFDQHLLGIELGRLPSAFRDAVFVTRILGVRYLWIDSLCIVQDDAEDWARESAAMVDIYRGSDLTLAAACSKSSQEGFLLRKRTGRLGGSSLLLPCQEEKPRAERLWLQKSRMEYKLYAGGNGADNDGMGAYGDTIDEILASHFLEPLCTRAWALQEALLSQRTVFFDSDQLFWECEGGGYLEGWTKSCQELGVTIYKYRQTPYKSGSVARKVRAAGLERPCYEGRPAHIGWQRSPSWSHLTTAAYQWWYEILNNYRSRSLTKGTDALPAISGIAKAFANNTNDQYLAGMWRGDILCGLTWRMDVGYRAAGSDPALRENYAGRWARVIGQRSGGGSASACSSCNDCFAPSWSWASIMNSRELIFRSTSAGSDVLAALGYDIWNDIASPRIPTVFR